MTAEEIAHSKRTAEISRILAEHADYDSAEVHEVYQAALLHDIGKTMIPVRIRCKSGSLSEVERSSMRKHTSIGHFLLLQTGTMLGTSSVVALQHHERLDGSGYLGLQDAEIHPHAKIVAVADVFDALISPRPYKRPSSQRLPKIVRWREIGWCHCQTAAGQSSTGIGPISGQYTYNLQNTYFSHLYT